MTSPKIVTTSPYEVFVYRTRDGSVVQRIPFKGTPRWEHGLNVPGSWQVEVALDSRYISRSVLAQLIEPWDWSWAIAVGSVIAQAGPVTSEDFSDDGSGTTTVSGVGLWGMYKEKRVLANAARLSTSGISTVDADLAFGPNATSDKGIPVPVANRNVSLYTIAKRIVENEQAKPGGSVPLALPDASWEVAGTSVREYLASELAFTGARLYELTQVQGGPEIMLTAEFTSTDRTSIRHRVEIGKPRLGQLGYPHAWTYQKACTKLSYVKASERVGNRWWEKGGGFDRNVITGFSEDLTNVTGGFLNRVLLEDVGQEHTSSDNATELTGYASADITNGMSAELEFAMEVTLAGDVGDGSAPPSPSFDKVNPGDTGVVFVRNHPRLRDGAYSVRIVRKASASTTGRGQLSTQILGVTYA